MKVTVVSHNQIKVINHYHIHGKLNSVWRSRHLIDSPNQLPTLVCIYIYSCCYGHVQRVQLVVQMVGFNFT